MIFERTLIYSLYTPFSIYFSKVVGAHVRFVGSLWMFGGNPMLWSPTTKEQRVPTVS